MRDPGQVDTLFEQVRQALGDRYFVESEIGRGGAAIVYRAEDRKHHRLVAIKVLRPEVAEAVGAETFIREIETVAQLNHPHILTLFDSGEIPGLGLPYFVTPFMPGETLKEKLAREGQLPVAEALDLARDISSALGYAHSVGIVHRDIKPGNILLSGGHAVVADFGVARAISAAREADPDRPWELVGTPLYMSPEQFKGDSRLDRRSDLYSLGCVLYEMLAGVPPFRGSTPQALMLQHLNEAPPSLRSLDREIPPALDETVRRLLAKAPADRFVTAQQVEDGLGAVPRPSPLGLHAPVVPMRHRRRNALIGAVAIAATLGGGIVWAVGRPGPMVPDRVAVLMTEGRLAGQDSRYALAVREEVESWQGLSVAPDLRVLDEVKDAGPPEDFADLRRLARNVEAGKLLRVEMQPGGDSLGFRLALYDLTHRDSLVANGSLHCAVVGAECERSLHEGTRRLLQSTTGYVTARPVGTADFNAYRSFARGMLAFRDWDLGVAERALTEAASIDPGFSEAHLNLAEVRWWLGRPADGWRGEAIAALTSNGLGDSTNIRLGQALLALADQRWTEACAEFKQMLRRDSLDYRAWYGRGECLNRDWVVLRDRSSPSGWSFRSSPNEAMASYARALELAPGVHRALGVKAFEKLSRMFVLDEVTFLAGVHEGNRAPYDSVSFGAWPDLSADTIAYVPWPLATTLGDDPDSRPRNKTRAILKNRSLVNAITARWVREFPESPDAHLARSLALESLREGALDADWPVVIAEAVAAQRNAGRRQDILSRARIIEVRQRVKAGDFAAARAKAESLLVPPVPQDSVSLRALASVAALAGRVGEAANLAIRGADAIERSNQDGVKVRIPPLTSETAIALLTYSAMGAPRDSIIALERRVERMIELAPAEQQGTLRGLLLARPAVLVFPVLGVRPAHEVTDGPFARLLALQRKALARDTSGLGAYRAIFEPKATRLSAVSVDASYTYSSLLLAAGDTAGAVRWIDYALAAMPSYGESLMWDDLEGAVPQAAVLPRMMALRSELGMRDGDVVTARRWASAVVALWQGADEALQPTVVRMKEILASTGG